MKKPLPLRQCLSFGFEQTFTIPEWWSDQGFVATSNTPLKLEKMRCLAECLAQILSGRFAQSEDIYKHLQYETFDAQGAPSFVVTMDPGSIEVKTQPLFIDGMEATLHPLFEAATLSGLVPYRNWWYGIKTGTEGGCHVNMAGLTPESNPLRSDPGLILKYIAFFHNNPWIHYPFMGVDVGPGGNCMRMDEHKLDPHAKYSPGSADSMERFEAVASRYNRGEKISAYQVSAHFSGCKLAEDKHSAPSLYKFKEPLFFIEDRAVEALRGPEDFFLVADLRLRILEFLQGEPKIQSLQDFGPQLHREMLSSVVLWQKFQIMCNRLGIMSEPYRCFFDRQFPVLRMGEDVPSLLELREGRRPRVITDIKMRDGLIISKTVDTNFARLELLWSGELNCVINNRIYSHSTIQKDGQEVRVVVLDYKKTSDLSLQFQLVDAQNQVIEKACFHPADMTFKRTSFQNRSIDSAVPVAKGSCYFNIDA